jgi:hypothetical protein
MKLRTIVERHAGAFGGNAALAKRIGITNSGLLRGIKANRLSLESLLRLADVTGESGATVLRLGGQVEMADLITRVFGDSRQALLTPGAVEERWTEIERTIARLKLEFLATLSGGRAPDGLTLETAPAPAPATRRKTGRVARSGRSVGARVAER